MSSFSIFYYTSRSMNDCCNAMDEPPRFQSGTSYRSDSEEGDIACKQCQCCIWPILLPIDLISCPFRAIHYLIKKCKSKNSS